jgi:hypothetical protein
MEDDPQDQQERYDDQGGRGYRPQGPTFPVGPRGGGGGGGSIFSMLPLLMGMFRGKNLLLLLLIGGVIYFMMGREGCSPAGLLDNAGDLTKGGFLDPKQFEKASIYEPLAEDNVRNPLPEMANLQRFAPAVGNQGKQGSCVAWSSAYAARSILEAARTGQKQTVYSPAFLYNQIGLQGCQGSYIIRAMEYMTKQGSIPYQQFPYDERDCSRQPDRSLIQQASTNRMRGFTRLSLGDRNDAVDIRAIKENLAQGAPVVIGMMVGQSFMQGMMGKDLWIPEANDRSMMGFGGHAMCLVGYDDKKYGGAFLIMNSWGPEWGNNGFGWVRYPEFNYYVREAYGLEPMARTGQAAGTPLQCEVGLVQVAFDGKKTVPQGYIPLRKSGNDSYVTTAPVRPGTKFKIEVRNNNECYIYVFGKETDGSGYTLFPYPAKEDPSKSKYSPFCGITGYRLFPRDKSMTPDSIGQRDMIAVVVSASALDWYTVQGKLNSLPRSQSFQDRLGSALASARTSGVNMAASQKGNIQFSAPLQPGQAAWCFVEIDKK